MATENKPMSEYTDQELMAEAKKMRSVNIQYALLIGFLIGIILFSVMKSTIGFFTLIPMYFVYKMIKNPTQDRAELERLLKERKLK